MNIMERLKIKIELSLPYTFEATGKVTHNQPVEFDYRYVGVDAYSYRSLGSTANDSFPNAVTLKSANLAGAPVRIFLIAARDIQAGDEITINYSNDSSVRHDHSHCELKPEELLKFAERNRGNMNKQVDEWIKLSQKGINFLDPSTLFISDLLYLTSTYSSLVICAARGAIDFPDLLKAYHNIRTKISAPGRNIKFILELQKFFEKNPSKAEVDKLLEKANSLNSYELLLYLQGNKNPTREDVDRYLWSLKFEEMIAEVKRESGDEK